MPRTPNFSPTWRTRRAGGRRMVVHRRFFGDVFRRYTGCVMTRRDTFRLGAAMAFPSAAASAKKAASLQTEIVRLKLKHTWTTVMSSSDFRDNLHIKLSADGVTGHGEGAPIVRYNENAESGRKAVESVRGLLTGADHWQFQKLMAEVFRRIEGPFASKAAMDI